MQISIYIHDIAIIMMCISCVNMISVVGPNTGNRGSC